MTSKGREGFWEVELARDWEVEEMIGGRCVGWRCVQWRVGCERRRSEGEDWKVSLDLWRLWRGLEVSIYSVAARSV